MQPNDAMSATPWPSLDVPTAAQLERAPSAWRPLLARLPEAVRSVIESGPDRGFLTGPCWWPEAFEAWNARPYEIHVILAWFYTAREPWNPWRGNEALRLRIEAMLARLMTLQSEHGGFPGDAPGRVGLAATAFGALWLGETVRMLKGEPAVDPVLKFRLRNAARRAILGLLSGRVGIRAHAGEWEAVWPAALAFLAAHPEETGVKLRLLLALQRTRDLAQSRAGYFHGSLGPGAGGPCLQQGAGVHNALLERAMGYVQDTPWSGYFVEKSRRWAEWLSYNLVPEGEGFLANLAPGPRPEPGPYLAGVASHLAREVPLLRALAPADAPPMAAGFSPLAWLQLTGRRWHPTREQRESARALLPYHAATHFSHVRRDQDRTDTFLYVRRKSYYAAFNACGAVHPDQRFGLGLLWHPRAGTLLLSRRGTPDEAWGTLGGNRLYEADIAGPEFTVGSRAFEPAAGAADLPPGDVAVTYPLVLPGDRKTVIFTDQGIRVDIRKAGAFLERLPLLLSEDSTIRLEDGEAIVDHPSHKVRLRIATGAAEARVRATTTRFGRKVLAMLELRAAGLLSYRLGVTGGSRPVYLRQTDFRFYSPIQRGIADRSKAGFASRR